MGKRIDMTATAVAAGILCAGMGAAQAIPPLSSIAIDKEALGAPGVALLLDKRATPTLEPTLPVQLIVRESSFDN